MSAHDGPPGQDRQARFSELYGGTYGLVLGYVRRRVGVESAEDIVADVFLTAWRHLDRAPAEPLPWLYRIAWHAIGNQRRGLARHQRLQQRAQALDSPLRIADHADEVVSREALAAAFGALTELDREVRRLICWEDLDPARGTGARLLSRHAQGPPASRSPTPRPAHPGCRRPGPLTANPARQSGDTMKDRQMIDKIEEALVRANPVPAEEVAAAAGSPEARALFHRIVAARPVSGADRAAGTEIPRTRARSRGVRLGIGVAATAAAAAAAIAIATSGQVFTQEGQTAGGAARTDARSLPAHLVDFTRHDGNIVVKITDVAAPVSQLNAIFRARGLHIKINVVPVSPSLVGTIVYTDVSATRELKDGSCQTGGGGRCWIGFILPAGFHGSGNLTVGRAARPGELYESTDSAFSRGESLHGSGLVGKPAGSALPVVRARHLGVLWMVNGRWTYSKATPRGTITKAIGWNSTTVVIDVSGPAGQVRDPLSKYEREVMTGKNKAEEKRALNKLSQSLLRQSIAH